MTSAAAHGDVLNVVSLNVESTGRLDAHRVDGGCFLLRKRGFTSIKLREAYKWVYASRKVREPRVPRHALAIQSRAWASAKMYAKEYRMNPIIIMNAFRNMGQLRHRENWTRERLLTYQNGMLGRIREYAYAHSPFYAKFHRGLDNRPLEELPVLTKAMVMDHFDDLVTDRTIRLEDVRAFVASPAQDKLYLNRYFVTATSGSTGRPGLFLSDRSEWAMVLASFFRAREYAGWQISTTHRQKYATVASTTPWHISSRVTTTTRSGWIPGLCLAATEPVEKICQQLNAWQPEMLVAYASMARILAGEQLTGRLHIQPHIIVISSEVLTTETRQRVRTAWGIEPFNQYAATETAQVAAECEQHQGLHLFEDLLIVEVVDEHNRPVPPGVFGEKLLVTVLFNRTVPLIRYELSDSVQLAAEACSCGRPFALIQDIQGRWEQVLRLPAANGRQIEIQPLTFYRIMDTVPASGWQVVQDAEGLTVLLSGASENLDDTSLAGKVAAELGSQGACIPSVKINRVPVIPKTALGKAPLIKCNLPS